MGWPDLIYTLAYLTTKLCLSLSFYNMQFTESFSPLRLGNEDTLKCFMYFSTIKKPIIVWTDRVSIRVRSTSLFSIIELVLKIVIGRYSVECKYCTAQLYFILHFHLFFSRHTRLSTQHPFYLISLL